MRLRELRLERGISQEALAGISNVSRPTIHRVEHCQQKPHRSTLVKLARALDVKPKDLAPELMAERAPGIELTQELVDQIMPTIKQAAQRYALNGSDVDDLIGAGREGVYEASIKYDPLHGVPFDYWGKFIAKKRVIDEARRLYKDHPRFGLEAQGVEPWTY